MAGENFSQDQIAPWLGTPDQKKAYEAKLRELENFITKQVQMTKGTHYLMHDMRLSAVTETRKLGEWVYISFISIKKEKQNDEALKMLFETRAFKKLKMEDPEHPKYINKSIFVKLGEYAGDDVIEPSRAENFTDDEIDQAHITRTAELKEVFYLLHLPIVPNIDQHSLDENWLLCNQQNDNDAETLEILTSLGLLAVSRIDKDKKGNISVGLTEKISEALQFIKSKPKTLPKIILGDDAVKSAKWILEKFFRDVKFQMPEEKRKIGITSKWAVDKKVDEIVKTLSNYGIMSISCESKKSPNFVIMQTKRAVYELKSGKEISYTELVNKLMALESAGKLDELPEDFSTVVPNEFRNSTVAETANVLVPRKQYRNHGEVYSLIFKKLGIPTYDQYKPDVKSVRVKVIEGQDYRTILILKDEKNSSTKQDIIDILSADGYECHFIGPKEGEKSEKKTICFYPKKEKVTSTLISDEKVADENILEHIKVDEDKISEPQKYVHAVNLYEPVINAIFSQLNPEEIKMLVSRIPALTTEIPEPVVVDKTADSIDKLLLVYKLVPAEKSESINPNIFASKEQVLKLLLSEDK